MKIKFLTKKRLIKNECIWENTDREIVDFICLILMCWFLVFHGRRLSIPQSDSACFLISRRPLSYLTTFPVISSHFKGNHHETHTTKIMNL
jgi:hypothetical protein